MLWRGPQLPRGGGGEFGQCRGHNGPGAAELARRAGERRAGGAEVPSREVWSVEGWPPNGSRREAGLPFRGGPSPPGLDAGVLPARRLVVFTDWAGPLFAARGGL